MRHGPESLFFSTTGRPVSCTYVCIHLIPGKAGPVLCEDLCSWAVMMLVCLLQGQWLHLSCLFPGDLFLKMTIGLCSNIC